MPPSPCRILIDYRSTKKNYNLYDAQGFMDLLNTYAEGKKGRNELDFAPETKFKEQFSLSEGIDLNFNVSLMMTRGHC